MRNLIFGIIVCACSIFLTGCAKESPKTLSELVAQRGAPALVAKQFLVDWTPSGSSVAVVKGTIYEPHQTNQWWNREEKILIYTDSEDLKWHAQEYYRQRSSDTNFRGSYYYTPLKSGGDSIDVVEFSSSEKIQRIRRFKADHYLILEGTFYREGAR